MKKLITILLCIILIFACGCTATYMDETAGDEISSLQDSSSATSSSVLPLYFRYYDEPMLIRNPLTIETTPQQQPEYYAISALISGALGQRKEITDCFGKKTALLSTKSEGEYLYVTLSDGFLSDTVGENDEQTRINRKMAIYSIVNTVCEMGNHSFVQIYLSQNGVILRPDSFEMGIAESKEASAPLGPLSRETELILTPSNVVKRGLSLYSSTEWSKLYYYLGDKDSAKEKLPILEEMTQEFQYLNLIMTDFSVEDNYTVSEDGKTAMVQVTFRVRSANTGYTVTNVPIEVVYKGRSWLISYESLLRHLEVAS